MLPEKYFEMPNVWTNICPLHCFNNFFAIDKNLLNVKKYEKNL